MGKPWQREIQKGHLLAIAIWKLPEIWWLQTASTYYLTFSVGQESRSWVPLVQSLFHKAVMKLLTQAAVISKLDWGQFTSKLQAHLKFFWWQPQVIPGYCLKMWIPCFSLDKKLLALWYLASRQKLQSLNSLMWEVTPHPFCCILVIKSKSGRSSSQLWEGITQGHKWSKNYCRWS